MLCFKANAKPITLRCSNYLAITSQSYFLKRLRYPARLTYFTRKLLYQNAPVAACCREFAPGYLADYISRSSPGSVVGIW